MQSWCSSQSFSNRFSSLAYFIASVAARPSMFCCCDTSTGPCQLRHVSCLPCSASLQQAPTLQALLPAGQPSQLLTGSPGFCGQPARATIQIQSACILPGKPALSRKPTYSVMYRYVKSQIHAEHHVYISGSIKQMLHAAHVLAGHST